MVKYDYLGGLGVVDEVQRLNASLISIGRLLAGFVDKCNGDKWLTKEQYKDVGIDFTDIYLGEDVEDFHKTERLMKELMLGRDSNLSMTMIEFLLGWDYCIKSVPIKLSEKNACCTITVYKNYDFTEDRSEPFYVRDTGNIFDTFCVLDGLVSTKSGAGVQLVDTFCSTRHVPVVLQAGFLFYGYYELWNSDGVEFDTIDKLVEYYEGLGFVNVNNRIGGYEDSVIMLWCDGQDRKKLDKVMSMDVF